PRHAPPPPPRRRGGDPPHLQPRRGRRGPPPPAARRTPRRPAAVLPHRHGRPQSPASPPLRQTDPVHQPRHLARRRNRGRLPLPIRRRVRLPPTQRPPRRVIQPYAPLDRPEDPRPHLLLRPRTDHLPPHRPPTRTRRPPPVRTRTPRRTRQHRRNRPALPRRRQRPPPRPTPTHRHDPNPTPPRRPVRHPPLRANPLTKPDG